MASPLDVRIARRLKVLREKRGLTQDDLAELMGLGHRQSRRGSALLFGLTATDARVVVLSVGVIAGAAALAAYVPATRARRISALEALRHE